MSENRKKQNDAPDEKPPLNPLGIVMLVLILIPATYGLLYLFGVDLAAVVADMLLDRERREEYFQSSGMQSARSMRRYLTDETLAGLVAYHDREMRREGYERIAADQDPPADKKWFKLLEKNGEMRLTFERGSQVYDVFAQERPGGGCIVFETVLPAAMFSMNDCDVPGVAVPPESMRYSSIHVEDEDSWLADYHSKLTPDEMAAELKARMEEMGWRCSEKRTEQIKLKPGTRMMMFENAARRCMIWIDPGSNGGSDVTISSMKLFAE